jgi:hypothetical protein
LIALIIRNSMSRSFIGRWRPSQGIDRAPVEHVTIAPSPAFAGMVGPARSAPSIIIVKTKDRSAVVPPDLPRRASPDDARLYLGHGASGLRFYASGALAATHLIGREIRG